MKSAFKTVKERQADAFDAMKAEFGYKAKLAAPRLVKVVVSATTGRSKDKNRNEMVMGRIAKITGQKPSLRAAKKSIAAFKLREGDKIGVAVTLRGARMMGFLDKFFNVAIPRTRDFRGYDKKSIDEMGNLTLGVKEQTIFPEVADEDIKDLFGLAVTIVTTAKNKAEASRFFDIIGVPTKK
ncbi:MAG: 50S ribosomal protein L5 [Candidatus Yonathbacteria bacterium RIFCSPHIGHO2_01_FULL_44_41]|uniref:Large ribosomal subunit protein uL5 n=1 Tax=Candidatus Yonathbacteria bacterium RIFCSPHIGHO2_02_FULL_44_14 TaxID=1802724 RepID=A0A1G2S8H9_9BACT|nr:MAG: 50S ribosomal protein L5 [Candidatus Yonathbacteria bacterium RIFCSPHIGHO2_01_FULL_44_41]OHA80581.1 MAG: 50S ribosomal protein L5 [Candidatus Yonathbacteria bacterium RIFCSPHIGHO2_02_FULL_44_14]OHA82127.1 MAG: 50S ribosomal protein L5 [Candidatus Yonathbacteria bacterium RIFCSPLOWO2_01_FULL_43_20]